MGRTTRSKNKRPRPDDNAENTFQIFRKIISTQKVTEEDVNELYSISKPFCNGCRVNSKDNPNCFCGLVPPLNGNRKSGLWQKTSEIVKSLGPDPLSNLRKSPITPAGLTNLGATCYANSILQCLYMNKSFRDGIFSVEPEVLSEDPVLNNLALLFAQLHSSKMSFVDSAPFIQTLQLDNDVQQDSHEFLTLLFSLLERCLRKSKVLKARTIVQNLFRGGVSHVTRCSKCGNESEASSNIEDFYFLELNVKGLKSLNDSLDDYFITEELRGDNQYDCCACATRVDATRSIRLRSLPAVLNFQLKRCVFLPHVYGAWLTKTFRRNTNEQGNRNAEEIRATSKKKITSAFSFPEELNMSPRLSDCSQPDMIFDLSAILIHKGSAVNSGHYIAHVKDENTNDWWEFDDENVSKMGSQPFGPTSSTKAGRSEPAESSSAPLEQESATVHHKDTNGCNSITNGTHHVQTYSSSDAYMLMYVQRHPNNDGRRHKMEVDCPAHLLKEVDTLNLKFTDSCEEYKLKKQIELDSITKRRQEVRSILSLAPAKCLEVPYFWISSDWLRQWADSLAPPAIDNLSLQCMHGKVPVIKTNYMKRLSSEAWTMLLSKYHGGPTLAKDGYCTACIIEMGQNMAHENVYMGTRSQMKELAEAALAGKPSKGQLYYISKSWLQQWLRRKIINTPCVADSGPTASIRCPHGQILPEIAPGAKRVLVPDILWNFIYDTAMAVNPQDTIGCSTFTQDSEPCSRCTEASFSDDSLREFKLRLRKNHEKLFTHKISALHPDGKYYLLPSSWLSELRTYINASGKNSYSAEIETLNTVVDKLLCEKHDKLLERPPELHWKRDLIFQKSSTTDGLTFIDEDDWRLLCEEFGGAVWRCISASIEVDMCVKAENIGPHKEMPCLEDQSNMNHEVNRNSSGRLVVKTVPQVCEECIGERESSELTRKLTYTNEYIRVYLVGKEPPKWLLEGSGSVADPGRRTSKRSRKSASENSINLQVSAYTSISQLKMMIWESLGVVKENQVLHKGCKSIDSETASLADESIFPGDVLWVTDSKIHEDRDIADELSDSCIEAEKFEEGFRGTLLTSTMSSQAMSEACSN